MTLHRKISFREYLLLFSLAVGLMPILFRNSFPYNVLLPINSFLAMGVLFYSYLRSKKINFLIFSIGSFAWGIGEILWFVLEINQIDASKNIFACSVYFITNCCLLITFILFSYNHSNKWNSVQLFLDILTISFLVLSFLWMFFLTKDFYIIQIMLQSGIISFLSIMFDVLISIGVLSWLFSIRSGKIAFQDKVIFSGILLFSFSDISFFYADFHNVYISNSLTDLCYVLSLQIIAFGVSLKVDSKEASAKFTYVTNIGSTNIWFFLFLFPLVALFMMITNTEVLVTLTDVFFLLIIILLYGAASKYVQLSIQNERLLEQQKNINDLLEKRVAEQVAELSYLANRDTLTTLFNRRYFYNCIDQSIKAFSTNETLALIFIDIDRFKKINDGFGHDVGDEVLIELSNRLIKWNQIGAVICRLGGDEFAIMILGNYTQRKIQECCKDLLQICYDPISIGDSLINMSVSLGVAFYCEEANSRKKLMKHADIAMYHAKSQSFNKYQFYDPLFNEDFDRNSKIELLLKQINIEKDFELFYQPQFSLPEMNLIGAEALIRWNHPKHGYIPPGIFIPIAEEIDRINLIGKWVIQESVKQSNKWNQQYLNNIKVGFNVSVKQLINDDFINSIKDSLEGLEINPEWLDIELTESIMISEDSKVRKILKKINKLGFSVSIDDFGAGYSSLSYLNKYNFDRIKIDKSLVDQVSYDNENGINVVKAVISMSKAVGIKTIAEGVETQEQLDILISLGCDEVQGYLLGKPVPSNIFEQRFLIRNDVIFQMSLQSMQYKKDR